MPSPDSLRARTTLFLAPLAIAYCLSLIIVTGVPLPSFGAVAAVMGMTLLALGCLLYVPHGVATKARGRGRFACPERLRWCLLGLAVGIAILPAFGLFKQLVLPVRGFVFDPLFAEIGRLALGGTAPWEVTHRLFGSLWPTLFLDRLYTFWTILFFGLPLIAPMMTSCERSRAQILIAWALAWLLIGTAGAWLLGSAGPCYYNDLIGPDPNYRHLMHRLTALSAQASGQGFELGNVAFQPVLLQAFHDRAFAPAGGISAAPSMHVTMAMLIALAARRVAPALGHVLLGYTVLIWIGSVHFGWHYAVDGPIGALLMLGVWRLSGWLVDRLAGAKPRKDWFTRRHEDAKNGRFARPTARAVR